MSVRNARSTSASARFEALVSQLEGLGMTHNEAIAWLTLVEDESGEGCTGYEVAARSAIPRSAVYGVLRRLEEMGAAFAWGTGPVRYSATPPADFVDQLRRAHEGSLGALAEGLAALPKRSRPEPVWILPRYDEVMARAGAMLLGAKRSVYLSAWPRELRRLKADLDRLPPEVAHRVVHSPALVPADLVPAGFSCWSDDEPEIGPRAAWSHKLILVIDHHEALIGGSEPDADNHAVWTTNPSIVDVATNHLILDLTLLARRRDLDCGPIVAPMMRPHLPRDD
jgi:hypothetical protein